MYGYPWLFIIEVLVCKPHQGEGCLQGVPERALLDMLSAMPESFLDGSRGLACQGVGRDYIRSVGPGAEVIIGSPLVGIIDYHIAWLKLPAVLVGRVSFKLPAVPGLPGIFQ